MATVATCYPCAKYLLLALTLFFWLSGLTLIASGIYFLLRPELQSIIHLFNFDSLPLSSIEVLACSLIIFGVIIFLIGLFGYCGAKRESRTCLILYIILVTTVLLAELGLYILIALYYDQGQILIKEHLRSQMKTYNYLYPSPYERAVDYIQNKFHCCGIDSAYDYSESQVPLSCCSLTSTSFCNVHQVGLIGTPGCFNLLRRLIFFWGKFFLIFELSLCAIALIGVFLAICVCQNSLIYDNYERAPYQL